MNVIAYVLLVAVLFLVLCVPAAAVVGFRAGLYKSGMKTKEDWRKGLALAMLITGSDRVELLGAMDYEGLPSTKEMVLGEKTTDKEEEIVQKEHVSRGTAFGMPSGGE